MNISKDQIIQAFNWLKRDNYYDSINLFLRKKIADFESKDDEIGNFDKRIDETLKTLQKLDDITNSAFQEWLDNIDFKIIPKKFKKQENGENNDEELGDENDNKVSDPKYTFISNLREQEKYPLQSFNYFIDAPIELLIISVLWCQQVGNIFDRQLHENCLGNRLGSTEEIKTPFTLFKYYLPMYNKWRDRAIDIGLVNLEKGNDILLIALDIKECYYNLEIKWESINDEIKKANSSENSSLLTNCIQQIHEKFNNKISNFLQETHYSDQNKYKNGSPESIIPIGLPSSGILANWELRKLDENITKALRPLYYGRYVDDFLLVLNYPDSKNIKKSKPRDIINEIFTKTGILKGPFQCAVNKEEFYYEFDGYNHLFLQSEKLIFHYYNHNSNWAGLTKFNDELRKQASEFRFLPEDFSTRELSDAAYDIEFNDSINKLRSVIGVNENYYKLVNYLYNLQLKKWLSNSETDKKTLSQLEKYYQGINILHHFKIWERFFSLLISERKWNLVINNWRKVYKCIDSVEYKNPQIQSLVIDSLKQYLLISLSLSFALLSENNREEFLNTHQTKSGLFSKNDTILENCSVFRKSHMIRHQFSSWPLLEYIDSTTDLLTLPDFSSTYNFDQSMFERPPRYIHFEDFQLLCFLCRDFLDKKQDPSIVWGNYTTAFLEKNSLPQEIFFTDDGSPRTISLGIKENKDDFLIGMVNLKVPDDKLEKTLSSSGAMFDNEELQKALYSIFNEAEKKPKCDLVILPEMSIPIHFLPFIVNQSRKRQIGTIFGCEHIIHDNECMNLVFIVLPEKNSYNYNNCAIFFRNKRHFAPKETELIESYGFHIEPSEPNYFRHYWRNCYFSVFNCFELTDITDRALFRAYLDLLIGISWNKDINRFSNIIDSTVGDLHCYMAYVNTSQYGHSRVVAPKRTEEMNIAEISGGENTVLLKGKIDVKSLREFQKHTYRSDDKRFKPTPAGFEHDIVRNNRQQPNAQDD